MVKSGKPWHQRTKNTIRFRRPSKDYWYSLVRFGCGHTPDIRMYYQSLPPAWEAFIIGHTLEPDPHAMIGGPKGRMIEPHSTSYNVPDRPCSLGLTMWAEPPHRMTHNERKRFAFARLQERRILYRRKNPRHDRHSSNAPCF